VAKLTQPGEIQDSNKLGNDNKHSKRFSLTLLDRISLQLSQTDVQTVKTSPGC